MTFMNPYGYIILFVLYRIGLGIAGKYLYKKYDLNGGFFWGFLLGIVGFLYVVIRVLFKQREINKAHARSAARQAQAEQELLNEMQQRSADKPEQESVRPARTHNKLR